MASLLLSLSLLAKHTHDKRKARKADKANARAEFNDARFAELERETEDAAAAAARVGRVRQEPEREPEKELEKDEAEGREQGKGRDEGREKKRGNYKSKRDEGRESGEYKRDEEGRRVGMM